ncbi:MAG: class I SAM-dependent methyltransferase [Ignavibacteriales bacterium]|nr:class I SAM-dependent methyltransferase [Ignavibacteriales bacterium]
MSISKEEIVNSFESAYNGTPAWEINKPQKEIIKWMAAGEINGRVLDVGCGTGENTIYLSDRGLVVIGVDVASAAILKARKKSWAHRSSGLFMIHDALNLETIGLKFDTIIDSGLFHVFSDTARVKFVQSIRSALRVNGKYLLLCFSENEPPGWGPRRVTQEEIKEYFKDGFRVNYIRNSFFETIKPQKLIPAWSASLTRI